MRAPTHVAFGLCSGSVMASFYANQADVRWGLNGLTAAAGALVVLGALCPDLDHQRALLSRALPFVSRPISRRWPHRTLMHSLAGMVLCALPVYGMLRLGYTAAWIGAPGMPDHSGMLTGMFGFAFASHLVVDTCTRHGVRWLYPIVHNPFGYPSVDHYRLITGDRRAEWGVTLLSLGLFAWFVPITVQGANVSLNNVIGGFKQLRDIYLHAVNTEVALEFEGYTARDKAPVAGRAVILEAAAGAFVVVWNGTIRTIGEEDAEIFLLRGRCLMLGISPQVHTVTYGDSRLSDIAADHEPRALFTGELAADRPFTVGSAMMSRSVAVSASSITLTYAQAHELETVQRRLRTGAESVSARARHLARAQAVRDSLMALRAGLPRTALYARERVYAQIEAQRKRIETLDKALAQERVASGAVRWSGRIAVREVPEIDE